MHYSDVYDDFAYNDILIPTAVENGSMSFTGDGVDPEIMKRAVAAMNKVGGVGVPTIKPWNVEAVMEKLDILNENKIFAAAMDIDGAGLPFLKAMNPNAGSKTVAELREIVSYAKMPFIIKGIMTVRGAEKAVEAGAKGIVVSNHGGRVLGQTRATADVLPEIAKAVKGQCVIMVDGGIPLRRGRLQGPRPGRGRGAHRPSLRPGRLRRRGRGREAALRQVQGRAYRHHDHVRRTEALRHLRRHGVPGKVKRAAALLLAALILCLPVHSDGEVPAPEEFVPEIMSAHGLREGNYAVAFKSLYDGETWMCNDRGLLPRGERIQAARSTSTTTSWRTREESSRPTSLSAATPSTSAIRRAWSTRTTP